MAFRNAKDAKSQSGTPATSDQLSDHLVLVQTRLTGTKAGILGLTPIIEGLRRDMTGGREHLLHRLESMDSVAERTARAQDRVTGAHATYIQSSTQTLQAMEGNTRIVGQTMGQVNDEVQGLDRAGEGNAGEADFAGSKPTASRMTRACIAIEEAKGRPGRVDRRNPGRL